MWASIIQPGNAPVYTEEKSQRFGYQYIGMTESGVHVLYTRGEAVRSDSLLTLALRNRLLRLGRSRYGLTENAWGEIGLGDR